MRELSVAEQRYEAVRAVIADGQTVTEVAARFGVARKTVHQWLARYEAGGWRDWWTARTGPGGVRIRCRPGSRWRCEPSPVQ